MVISHKLKVETLTMMSEKIRIAMIKRKKTGKDLAIALGCSSQNIYAMLKKDNWNEEQLRKIADILDCDFKAEFEFRDTHETV